MKATDEFIRQLTGARSPMTSDATLRLTQGTVAAMGSNYCVVYISGNPQAQAYVGYVGVRPDVGDQVALLMQGNTGICLGKSGGP